VSRDMATSTTKDPESPPLTLPPLENGDRLSRVEFERRYNAMPHLNKAELIEGVVHMPSPVGFERHGNPHFNLNNWLGQYCVATPGVVGGDNASIRLDLDNMPQPDIFLMIRPSHGGHARISTDDIVEGAPELVVEVASSSVSIDLHSKLNVYRRNEVQEYLVWRVQDRAIDWFVLRGGQYDRLAPEPSGLYQSEVFPGLWFDPAAMAGGDLARVLETARGGLGSDRHAGFVARLQETARQLSSGA
jgi:Uma2 family endonuclease